MKIISVLNLNQDVFQVLHVGLSQTVVHCFGEGAPPSGPVDLLQVPQFLNYAEGTRYLLVRRTR